MNLGDDDLLLLCVIEGETEGFSIDIERSLWRNPKFMVCSQDERKNSSLAGVDAHILELWKPNDGNPINVKPKQTLPGRVTSIRGSGEELDPCDTILTIFPNQPPLDRLHIIVRKPDAVIQQKRALPEPAEDIFHRLKRAKTVTTSSSTTAKPEYFEPLQQEPSEKIFDDRPEPDPDIPSVALLYEGFGHFLDIMDGRHDVPGLADIDVAKLQTEVDELASKMNKYYTHEDDRGEAALPCLTRHVEVSRSLRSTQLPLVP